MVSSLQGTLDLPILLTADQSKWDTFSRAMALILNPVDQGHNELVSLQVALVENTA